jgi:hypothetical protein
VWDVAWLRQAYPVHRHVYDYAGVYYTSGDRIIASERGTRSATSTAAWDTFFFRRGVKGIAKKMPLIASISLVQIDTINGLVRA